MAELRKCPMSKSIKKYNAQPKLHRNMKRELRLWQRKWGYSVDFIPIICYNIKGG